MSKFKNYIRRSLNSLGIHRIMSEYIVSGFKKYHLSDTDKDKYVSFCKEELGMKLGLYIIENLPPTIKKIDNWGSEFEDERLLSDLIVIPYSDLESVMKNAIINFINAAKVEELVEFKESINNGVYEI